MRRNLAGKSILVTGASRGIGRRVAERLARLGARVIVSARTSDELDVLVRDIRAAGGEAFAVPVDLTDPIQRQLLVTSSVEAYGGLDVLVNAAGVASFGEFATSSPEILRKVMEINFFAPADLIRLAQPYLHESRRTHGGDWRPAILNLASICGRCGIPSLPEHCASKHALVGLSETLRLEFDRFDIDVLLVLPGLVRSDDIHRHLIRNEGRIHLDFEGAQPPDEVADSIIRSLVRNRAEVSVGFVSRVVWISRRLWPRILRWVMQRKVRRFARREKDTGRS